MAGAALIGELLLPGEYVLGQAQLVADLIHLVLNGLVDRHAVLAREADLIRLFAGGVDAVVTGRFFAGAQGAQDVAGGFLEGIQPHEGFGINGDKEVTQMVGNLFAVFADEPVAASVPLL